MKKKIVVIGGGFAGVSFTEKIDFKKYDVILIDKLNHHQFQPLFYQVATSQIEPSSISFPLRYIFKENKSIQIRMAEVYGVLPEQNKIETSIGNFDYDFLVIATGCKTNFFNNKIIEQNALTLKSTYDAIAIRNHIISVFEKLIIANNDEAEFLKNIVIVGAGPTGVELAGAFAEIKCEILPKDYPGIDFSKLSIYLIEGSKHTLNSMSDTAQKASYTYLIKMGVKIFTETFVKSYDGKVAEFNDGTKLPTSTLIWAAGVLGNKIEGLPDNLWLSNNRIKVNRFNQIIGFENIFALGDIAFMQTEKYPNGHPQVANVAINQAKLLAKNLNKIYSNKMLYEFEYKDLGAMATIGRNKAVVDLPFLKFKGYFAWLVWIFLHLMYILTIRNKLIIFINWTWSYLTKNSSLRLILKSEKD
ncbi:MAG: NAD(P)/FAD-dependent oxidoreductase [Bacteroidetes bacterium]|nr:NAD(P)/FAD-dependent oxidoreductase [Bacteroidota bacterium]